MKVKRIFAPDMRQAMRRVRDEIGPDAVIVSNHKVAGGVEVVAAHETEYQAAKAQFRREHGEKKRRQEQVKILTGHQGADSLEQEKRKVQAKIAQVQARDENPMLAPTDGLRNRQLDHNDEDDLRSILESLKQRQNNKALTSEPVEELRQPRPEMRPEPRMEQLDTRFDRPQEQPSSSVSRAVTKPKSSVEDPAYVEMRQEIHQLKEMLQQQAARDVQPEPQTRPAYVEPAPAAVGQDVENRLGDLGLSGRLSRHFAAAVPENAAGSEKAWRNVLARLAESVPVVGEDFIERGGMIAFVGPTGVGKTTTIGKLAAQYVLRHGSSSIALVTTDSYRIAAHEQLKTFGRILDVPVRVVDENHSLDDVLNSLRNKRAVLVDTAGMSAHEPHTQQQKQMLLQVSVRLKKLLVLSCSSQKHVIDGAYATYKELGLNGCVLSKLDESGSLGEALSLAIERQLPVAYITDGQKVPDDIEVAQRNDLTSRAVLIADRSRSEAAVDESGPGLTAY